MKKLTVPIFFSCDDNYIPFLAAAIRSLSDNSSKENAYVIRILNSGLKEENVRKIRAMQTENVIIRFTDVTKKISPFLSMLNLRDYYTASIYFRIFIPAMFPEYKKAIYLDSDIIVLSDVAELYNTPLGDNMLAGVPDDIIASRKEFIDYAELGCGIKHRRYFNSGVMLMNLELMRKNDIEGTFSRLMNTYHFNTVCPDQDYLNVICKDKVLYLDKGWNKMSIDKKYNGVPKLIHFNMFNKPWQYDNISYGEYFWEYAKKTDFYEEILEIRRNFGEKQMEEQQIGLENLVANAVSISNESNNFRSVLFEA